MLIAWGETEQIILYGEVDAALHGARVDFLAEALAGQDSRPSHPTGSGAAQQAPSDTQTGTPG